MSMSGRSERHRVTPATPFAGRSWSLGAGGAPATLSLDKEALKDAGGHAGKSFCSLWALRGGGSSRLDGALTILVSPFQASPGC